MDDATKLAIVEEAKTWRGTKWKHNVALKGWGVDCAQFLISLGKKVNLIPQDYKTQPYTRDWCLHNSESQMIKELEKFCNRISMDSVEVGDVIVYKWGRCATHAAIYTGNGEIIHAHMRHGVTDSTLDREREHFDSVWRFRG